MAQQHLNIGLVPGDGTGAPLRTSLGLIEQNFTELYALLSAVQSASTKLVASSNLSDLTNVAAARQNLGLGTAAVKASSGSGNVLVSLSGSVTVGNVPVFTDVNGTIGDGGVTPGSSSGNTNTSGTGLGVVMVDGTTVQGSTATPVAMVAANRTVIFKKTTNVGPSKALMPAAPTLGVIYTFIDGKGDAGTNNATLAFPAGVTGTFTGGVPGVYTGQATFVLSANNDAIGVLFASATDAYIV